MIERKHVLLAPLDPVHDIGLKMIKRAIEQAGHETKLLPPDYTPEEVVKAIGETKADVVLVSRTLGYGVAELLGKFIDLVDASGLRDRVKLGIGGMAIRPELAAELGFDAGFGPGTPVEAAVAFVEGRTYQADLSSSQKTKRDMTEGYGYQYRHSGIEKLLDEIVDGILKWSEGKSSPAIKRAELRQAMFDPKVTEAEMIKLKAEYQQLCDPVVAKFYESGEIHPKTRRLTEGELKALDSFVDDVKSRITPHKLQHTRSKPMVLAQYGTGCPFMDIAHIMTCEAWGADGVIHFDPSWGARTEGFFEGYLTHTEDGSVITPENLRSIRQATSPWTLWQVRAHRGLNTPETVVLAGLIGADMTKINIAYGSLGAGTDPARLTIDAVAAIRHAAAYNLPFDVVTNEELCGVPAFKAFAGMLITAHLGRRLKARPVLQPLFCYSPEVMINGQMNDNYVDFNAAKIMALRSIIDAPIWPGAPIGFLTQIEDRVQSSMSTALHAALASSLEVDAISIASSDEAYSGGPIVAASRVDTLRAVQEAFRFFGQSGISPTTQAKVWADDIVQGIEQVLKNVITAGGFVDALYAGVLGSPEDGAYPGRSGRGTVIEG